MGGQRRVTPDGRTRHYGAFYGIDALPEPDGRPLAVVVGNCQAESLRVLLGDGVASHLRTVRIPPVFELTESDLPHLHRVLARADVLVAQPVRDDYRGLPLGTAQVRSALPEGARTVLVPPVRYAGLYPRHVIVRSGGGAAVDPGDAPLVPYHDLATALVAAGRPDRIRLSDAGVRAVARRSLEELERRERAHGTVVASDLLRAAGEDAAHTINHPGNPVLIGLARRVEERLGLPPAAVDPGRTLLRAVYAPLEEPVCRALSLPAAAVRETWTVGGRQVTEEEVREAHLAWYAHHPGLADHVVARSAETLTHLGVPTRS